VIARWSLSRAPRTPRPPAANASTTCRAHRSPGSGGSRNGSNGARNSSSFAGCNPSICSPCRCGIRSTSDAPISSPANSDRTWEASANGLRTAAQVALRSTPRVHFAPERAPSARSTGAWDCRHLEHCHTSRSNVTSPCSVINVRVFSPRQVVFSLPQWGHSGGGKSRFVSGGFRQPFGGQARYSMRAPVQNGQQRARAHGTILDLLQTLFQLGQQLFLQFFGNGHG